MSFADQIIQDWLDGKPLYKWRYGKGPPGMYASEKARHEFWAEHSPYPYMRDAHRVLAELL